MPYIPPDDRPRLDHTPVYRVGHDAKTLGELTYCFFLIARQYALDKGGRFQHWAEARAALREAHDELGRRELAPYEDAQIAKNGDV